MPRKFAAGALLLYRDPQTGRTYTLLQQRSDEEHEPRTWCTYGGMSEPGETPERAMIREVEEESGIDVERCQRVYVGRHDEPHNEFSYHLYAVTLPERLTPRHSRETLDAQWIALGPTADTLWENAPRPLHSGMNTFVRDPKIARLLDMVR